MKLSKASVYWHLGERTRKFKGLLILLVGLVRISLKMNTDFATS